MRIFGYLLRSSVLLLLVFAISRLLFLGLAGASLHTENYLVILASFYHGLKTDLSAVCYILLLPLALAAAECIYPAKVLYHLRSGFILLVLFINAMITSAEPGLYQEWGTKITYKALLYLQHPAEIFHTATPLLLAGFLLSVSVQSLISLYLYRRIVQPADQMQRQPMASLVILPLVPVLLIGIRGGTQEIPMSAGDSYYTGNPALNWSAVNSIWNLGQSILTGMQYGRSNPYRFMHESEAEASIQDLFHSRCDSSAQILTHRKPNIVLIIFEGWSAELISSISGNKEHSCAPNFDRLAGSGLLFSRCYASGERSDQGLTAILSGFPALPLSSIVNYTSKVDKLPSLLDPFRKDGYSSFFLFGGQLGYGNLSTLIYHNRFGQVTEERDIPSDIYRGRLGVHDQHTFDILQRSLDTLRPPFFAGFFTQSTHFSYDYPAAKKTLPWAGKESDYASSLMYADSCLGDFMAKARRKPWYDSTLFIFVADHSHVVPWDEDHRSSSMHHIPLLLFGTMIKEPWRGKVINNTVSQQDLPATLLSQAGYPCSTYSWSHDALSACAPHLAYWTFTEGFGMTTDSCEIVYDLAGKKVVSSRYDHCDSSTYKKQAFSYIQMVMDDFLRK